MQEGDGSTSIGVQTRNFFLAYFAGITAAVLFSLVMRFPNLMFIGVAILVVGIFIFAVAFLQVARTGRFTGYGWYWLRQKAYERVRSQDKRIEGQVFPVMFASLLLIATGYLMIRLFN